MTEGSTHSWTNGKMYGWMGGGERMDGQMDGQTDRWMDRQTDIVSTLSLCNPTAPGSSNDKEALCMCIIINRQHLLN